VLWETDTEGESEFCTLSLLLITHRLYRHVYFYILICIMGILTSGGRSVGIVRSRTQTMEFSFLLWEFLPSLWSSGQGSWLQIQRFGFDSRRYQIF
jgi:hypothetical protein